MLENERLEAAPTMLVGIGASGRRLSKYLGERLSNSILRRTGMLEVLSGDSDQEILDALERLTRQQTVLPAELGLSMRDPNGRYLRLQLVLFASVSELNQTQLDRLYATASTFCDYPHPPESLRLAFVLDASVAKSVKGVASNLDSVLQNLDATIDGVHEKSGARSAKIILAHRSLMDGTHLLHDNLGNADAINPDEFEGVLARLVEALLLPSKDGGWKKLTADKRRHVFVGGGSAIFPRNLLLKTVTGLLTADHLEAVLKPREAYPESTATRFVESRSKLFLRLSDALREIGIEFREVNKVSRPPSLFEKYILGKTMITRQEGVWFDLSSRMHPIAAVALSEFPAVFIDKQKDIVKSLEEDAKAYVGSMRQAFLERECEKLREQVDAKVASTIGAVECVTTDLDVTLQSLNGDVTAAEADALISLEDPGWHQSFAFRTTAAAAPPFVPQVDSREREPVGELLKRLTKTVKWLPQIPAVVARGLMLGALIMPIAAHLSWRIAGWLTALGTVLLFLLVYYFQRLRAERLRDLVIDSFEDSLAKKVYDIVQFALGSTCPLKDSNELPVAGIVPVLYKYVALCERPLVSGFAQMLQTSVDTMRQTDGWYNGFQPGVDWINDDDPKSLYAEITAKPTYHVPTSVQQLLVGRSDGDVTTRLLSSWRSPSLARMEIVTGQHVVRYVEPYVSSNIGDLVRLVSTADPNEVVLKRLDLLAYRCVPLAPFGQEPSLGQGITDAPAVETHPDTPQESLDGSNATEDGIENTVSSSNSSEILASGTDNYREPIKRGLWVNVPESLNWSDAAVKLRNSSPTTGFPEQTGFRELEEWLITGNNSIVGHEELDFTSALAIFPVADAATAVRWLRGNQTVQEPDVVSREPRIAFIVGMGDYNSSPLPEVARDMELMESSLSKLGFEVIRVLNEGASQTQSKLKSFGEKIMAVSSEKVLTFFYFSGHGCEVNGSNVLQLVDDSNLPITDVYSVLAQTKSTNIVVIDACRSPIKQHVESGQAPPADTIIVYSTTEAQTAGDGYYSPELAKFLLEPNEDFAGVLRKTREAVIRKSGGQQVPWEESSLVSEIILRPL